MGKDYENISYIDGHLHIQCRACNIIKPEEKFHVNNLATFGRVYKCIDCFNTEKRGGVTLETANEKSSSTAKEILMSMGYDINGDIHSQFLKRMKDKGREI